MSATEELRRMLDERGVERRKPPHYSSESMDDETIFQGNGIEWCAKDHQNGRLGLRALRYEVTPEQAIEATLGRKTCHIDRCYCDQCHTEVVAVGVNVYGPEGKDYWTVVEAGVNYCPNCGARVVE